MLIESLLAVIVALIKVLFIGVLIAITYLIISLQHKMYVQTWVKDHPPIDNYLKTSQANIDPWRWRKPNLKSNIPFNYKHPDSPGIKDSPQVSSFVFRPGYLTLDFLSPASGLVLMGFTLLLMFRVVSIFVTEPIPLAHFLGSLCLCLGIFAMGVCLLRYGDRVLRIDLYPDRVEFITMFVALIPRTVTYKREQLVSARGDRQSFWAMERGQTQPDYNLIITRTLSGSWWINETFHLRCDPTQGSWIVGGLNHWKSLPL